MKESPLEKKFKDWLECEGITDYIEQYRYDPSRRWRADFAFPSQKILVELNGIDHFSNWTNIKNDAEKWNHAQKLGWKVFCFPSNYLEFDTIRELIDPQNK